MYLTFSKAVKLSKEKHRRIEREKAKTIKKTFRRNLNGLFHIFFFVFPLLIHPVLNCAWTFLNEPNFTRVKRRALHECEKRKAKSV